MTFPKMFSCPSMNYKEYKVNFEVNVIVLLSAGFKITKNIPIILVR